MSRYYEIKADYIPEGMPSSEYLRLLKAWIKAIQPHTVFDCDRITVSEASHAGR